MDFLDSWIFRVVLDQIVNKICRLIYNVYFDNYSHEYKTRRILDLDKILLAANEEGEINDGLYKFGALNGHQGPPKAPDPNLKKKKYHVLVTWATGEKTYKTSSVLAAGAPVTFNTYDGWTGHNNRAKCNRPFESHSTKRGDEKFFQLE